MDAMVVIGVFVKCTHMLGANYSGHVGCHRTIHNVDRM